MKGANKVKLNNEAKKWLKKKGVKGDTYRFIVKSAKGFSLLKCKC